MRGEPLGAEARGGKRVARSIPPGVIGDIASTQTWHGTSEPARRPAQLVDPALGEVGAEAHAHAVGEGHKIRDAHHVVVARADMPDEDSDGVHLPNDATGMACIRFYNQDARLT